MDDIRKLKHLIKPVFISGNSQQRSHFLSEDQKDYALKETKSVGIRNTRKPMCPRIFSLMDRNETYLQENTKTTSNSRHQRISRKKKKRKF